MNLAIMEMRVFKETLPWVFGDMPAVQGLDRDDVQATIAYVRALQVENGIN
jgi:hypothetical protein